MFNNPYMNNMNGMNNMYSPYSSYSPIPTEIPRVNGMESAQNYPMAKDSSALVLDSNAPIVYMLKTDSSGFKTIKPFTISEFKPEPEIDMRALLDRVDAIEKRLNDESDNRTVERNKTNNATNRASKVFDEYDTGKYKSDGNNSRTNG